MLARWIAAGAPEVDDRAGRRHHDARSAGHRQGPRLLGLPAAAAGRGARRPRRRPGPQPDRRLRPAEARSEGADARRRRPTALTLLRRASFDLTGLPPEPAEVQAFLADRVAGRLREADRPPARVAALRRALGPALARPGRLRRLGRASASRTCRGRTPGAIATTSSGRSTPTSRTTASCSSSSPATSWPTTSTRRRSRRSCTTTWSRPASCAWPPTRPGRTSPASSPTGSRSIADEIDVLGSAVMGLTLKCARCHSHKFDPIPQRDYYRLVAVFKGAYDEHDWLKPDVRPGIGPVSQDVLGGRHLPYVTTAERRAGSAQRAIEQEIDALKAAASDAGRADQGARSPAPPSRGSRRCGTAASRRRPTSTAAATPLSPGRLVGPGVPSVLTDGKTPFEVQPPWPGAKSDRPAAGVRALADAARPSADGARGGQPRLEAPLRHAASSRRSATSARPARRRRIPSCSTGWPREFVRQGWSLKAMHRLMMTSATYRQSSAVTPEQREARPGQRALLADAAGAARRRGALRHAAAGRRPARRDRGSARPTRCRCARDGLVTPDGHRARLAAADLRAADAQAAADAPGDLRLPADEPQLPRAARLDRRPAGAAPDEQRHGRSSWPSSSPSGCSREAGRRPGAAGRARST